VLSRAIFMYFIFFVVGVLFFAFIKKHFFLEDNSFSVLAFFFYLILQ